MFFIASLFLLASTAQGSVRPGTAVFGVLQTPPPARDASPFQFAGVYAPGNGVYWHARRRSLLQTVSDSLRCLRDIARFRDIRPLRDDCPQQFMYRILVLNKLNAIKNAAKRGLVSLEVDGNKLTVSRNGFLRKLITNSY